jgi:hypothetical protein
MLVPVQKNKMYRDLLMYLIIYCSLKFGNDIISSILVTITAMFDIIYVFYIYMYVCIIFFISFLKAYYICHNPFSLYLLFL